MPSLQFKGKELLLINKECMEPVKIGSHTYGKQIIFHNGKRKVKFISAYNPSLFISYKEIESIELKRVNKKRLYILSTLLLVLFVGVFIAFFTIYMPPWTLTLKLKNGSNFNTNPGVLRKLHKKNDSIAEIKIRLRISEGDARELAEFFTDSLKMKIIDYKNMIKNKNR